VAIGGQRKSPHRTNRSPATAVRRGALALRPTGYTSHRREDGTVRVWDAATGRRCAGWRATRGGDRAGVQSNGPLAAVRRGDRLLRLWEVEHGREARVLRGHTGRDSACVTICADGKRALSGGNDGGIRLGPDHWRAADWLGGHDAPVTRSAVSRRIGRRREFGPNHQRGRAGHRPVARQMGRPRAAFPLAFSRTATGGLGGNEACACGTSHRQGAAAVQGHAML